MSMLPNFVRQLPKLKEVHLRETVARSDPKPAAEILEDLHNRPSPVHLYFTNEYGYQDCSLVPVVYAEATSSEESNIEESDSDSEESE